MLFYLPRKLHFSAHFLALQFCLRHSQSFPTGGTTHLNSRLFAGGHRAVDARAVCEGDKGPIVVNLWRDFIDT